MVDIIVLEAILVIGKSSSLLEGTKLIKKDRQSKNIFIYIYI